MAISKRAKHSLSHLDFSQKPLPDDDLENYEFINCIFPKLSNLNFTNCVFKSCNLSNLLAGNSRLQNITFIDCKLLGLNFSGAKDFAFEVHFENCNMDYVSFDRKKLNASSFKNCRLHNANFTQADLSKSTFSNCDFLEALFSNTNLNAVDFTSNTHFLIDPERNSLKKAKFAIHQLPMLLYRYDILVE